jgi:dsDNA-specific endonuclease/ATPase MutS2
MNMGKEEDVLLWSAESGEVSEVDLHGMRVAEAQQALETFLHRVYFHKERAVRIIHGRGDGQLRGAVHQMLATTDFIDHFQDATHPSLAGAVTVALFCSR